MASIKLEDLTVTYNRHPAVHHISGEFADGSLTAIAGPNGAGKSTLLKAIAGILKANSGEIIINGAHKSEIAYLPQATEIERNFPISIFQFVSTGLWQQSGSFGKITKAMKIRITDALTAVGLKEFADYNIGSLSTGQFQRALFARLLLQDAKIILLDEPFNAIDNATVLTLVQLIKNWHDEGRTVICVLHDLVQIHEYFPDCLLLAKKSIAWGKSDVVLTGDNLAQINSAQIPLRHAM